MKTKSAIQMEQSRSEEACPTAIEWPEGCAKRGNRSKRTKNCLKLCFLCFLFLGILPVSADELVIESDLKVEGKVEVGQSMIVSGDDGVLFLGDGPSNPFWENQMRGSGNIPIEGAGARFMWYPAKAALRAGLADGTEWDDSMIGFYSAAFGRETTASADASTAIGLFTTASGYGSIAMGFATNASETYSTAMGYFTWALGYNSIAMGDMTEAVGSWSMAMGSYTDAWGISSTAMGSGSMAFGVASTAMGDSTTASGYASTAMGYSTVAASRNSLAIGQYNIGGGHPTQWIPEDPLFEIGNGTGHWQDPIEVRYRNAFTVYKNGNVEMTGKVTMPRQGDILMGDFGEQE